VISKPTKYILDFKFESAETMAWLYDFCREQGENNYELNKNEIRQDIIKFCKMLDMAESGKKESRQDTDLVEFIRRTRGVKPADNELLSISEIFPNRIKKTSLLEKITALIDIDLGDIEDLLEKVIAGILAIRDYLARYYQSAVKASGILEKLDLITESLKKMRSNTHLLVHVQTKLEMSQFSRAIA
jgi:hypothetical protein